MKRKKLSLSVKILMILMMLIVPLNVFAFFISAIMIQDTKNVINDSIRSTVNIYKDELDQIIYNTDNALQDLIDNNLDCYLFQTSEEEIEYQLAKVGLASYINTQKQFRDLADCIWFYRGNYKDLFVIPNNKKIFRKFIEKQPNLVEEVKEHFQWHIIMLEAEPYLIKMGKAGDNCYGAFISLNNVVKSIDEYIEYPIREIVFSEEELAMGKDVTNVSARCSKAKVVISLVLERNFISTGISVWRWFLVAITMIYIGLVPVIYLCIRKLVLTPLSNIIYAHKQLEQGVEEYRIYKQAYSEEFFQVYASFNHMAESLQHLRLEKINNELTKRQMIIDNLQLQIRPHFLLNTLNLLYSMMQTNKVKPAQKMVLYLSEYFRYLFKYAHELELFDKEWKLILKYLEVSEFQYPGAFTFHYELDPEISYVRVPPLLLHNFFENILSHALVHGKVVNIVFTGFYNEGIVTFQIADDGRGMPKEIVNQINSGEYVDCTGGTHIGLKNSIVRLKYFYNQKGTVTVESMPDEGTIFTINFPYDLEREEENDVVDGK